MVFDVESFVCFLVIKDVFSLIHSSSESAQGGGGFQGTRREAGTHRLGTPGYHLHTHIHTLIHTCAEISPCMLSWRRIKK